MPTVPPLQAQRMPRRPARGAVGVIRVRSAVRVGAAFVVGMAALGFAGCTAPGAEPGTSPSAGALPAGVSVELIQLRADVAPRHAQVHVTNGSDAAITIADVRVEDPRFDGLATRVVEGRTSTIPAGRSVDVRVQLAPVDCEARDGSSTVVLELVDDRGSREVTAAASDPLGFVAPLHERECRRERLSDAATVAFTSFMASPAGEPAALELTITPTGTGAATIVGVQRTNLLEFQGATAEGAYPLDLEVAGEGTQPVVVELPLVPFRCDPHAVQEDKRGTIFGIEVEVGGDSGDIEVFVGDEMRGDILSWVAEWCDFDG